MRIPTIRSVIGARPALFFPIYRLTRRSPLARALLVDRDTEVVIEGSGASSLDLADFTVDTAEVRLSGASEATVNALERIDPVDVSGASRLRYLGDPSLGEVSTSGGSSVDKLGD